MKKILLLMTIAFCLSSCGVARNVGSTLGVGKASSNRTTVENDGIRYRARASATREDRRNFIVTVSPVAQNPEGALEAGRYQATRYCLLTFGGSDTDWTIGPETPISEIPIEGKTLTLTGRCTQK